MPGLSDLHGDSIASSHSYYTNPYRQDRDYSKAERVRNMQMRTIDRLESTQERIERELLEKILAKKGKFSVQNFLLLKHFGKFVFMIVMLPPYILFYGMPKLALKKLSVFLQTVATQTSVFLSKFAAASSLYLKRVYVWPQSKALWLSSKIKEMAHQIAHQINNKWVQPVVRFVKQQQVLIKQFSVKMAAPFAAFAREAAKFMQVVKQKLSGKFKFRITFPALHLSLPAISLKNVREKWNRLKVKVEDISRAAKKRIQDNAAVLSRMIESSWLFLWQPLSQLKIPKYHLPSLDRVKEMYAKAAQLAKQVVRAISQSFAKAQDKAAKSFEKMANGWEKLKTYVNKQISKFSKPLFQKWQALKKPLAAFVKKWDQLPGKAKEKWQNFKKNAKGKFTLARDIVLKKSMAFAALLSRFVQLIARFVKNFFFALRILYAVVCLFLKFTLQGIKDKIAEEL